MKTSHFFAAIFVLGILCICQSVSAQDLRDTIITKNKTHIICKITKITDTDIEYKKEKEADAIIYSVDKSKVKELHLANGKVELIMPDEMDMHQEAEIIDKRSALKLHFFSPFYDHLALTYEKSIKMGINLEVGFGFINNSMFNFGVSHENNLVQGGSLVIGPKFILGHSYYIKGMKYSHPLKGAYFKPEIIYSNFNISNLKYYLYPGNSYLTTDKRINTASLLVTFGNQYILGNTLTFGFNFGIGYSLFTASKFSNPEVEHSSSQYPYPYYWEYSTPYDYYMFNQVKLGENFPMVLTSSITLGYIFK